MKANIKVNLKPFTVPNYVLSEVVNENTLADDLRKLQGSSDNGRKFHVSEIDAVTLERLCENFTNEIFKKAGKSRPDREAIGS